MLVQDYDIMRVEGTLNEKFRELLFENILYVLEFDVSLMSTMRLKKNDFF